LELGDTGAGGFFPEDSTLVSLVTLVVPSGPEIFVVSWTPAFSEQPAKAKPRAAVSESARTLVVRIIVPSSIKVAGVRASVFHETIVTWNTGGLGLKHCNRDASRRVEGALRQELPCGICLATRSQ
jgi:hypothetical protein